MEGMTARSTQARHRRAAGFVPVNGWVLAKDAPTVKRLIRDGEEAMAKHEAGPCEGQKVPREKTVGHQGR
jgi:hypothetical protein